MRWFVQIRISSGWLLDGSCCSRFCWCSSQSQTSTITDSSCTKPSCAGFESTGYCFRFLERSSTLLLHNAWSLCSTHTTLIHAAICLSKAIIIIVGLHLLLILLLQQLIEDLHPLTLFTSSLETANRLNWSVLGMCMVNIGLRLCLLLRVLLDELRRKVLYVVRIIWRMVEIGSSFRWKWHLGDFWSLRSVWLASVLVVLVFIVIPVIIYILFDDGLRCSWLSSSSLSSNWRSGDEHLSS